MTHDQITGIPITVETTSTLKAAKMQGAGGERVPVYEMVGIVANGLAASGGKCITPGGAYPQVPGLAPGTEVYQFVAGISHGIGYGPGNALVNIPIPFQASPNSLPH